MSERINGVEATTKIKRVLIANRGAIAVRIIRTLRNMGIESLVIYAEIDRESLHVRQADHAFSLGEGAARETYLNQDLILDIAKKAKADAIHPGYGFLSENTEFVERCTAQGVVFLGPTPDQIEAFGLKHSARALAEEHRVPLLPGTGVLSDVEDALQQAERIGYPVMLKSSAGGGGIGMQLCWSAQELDDAYESVSKLSVNNFSNAALFLEKFVEQARHIEVQIFGDGQGNAIALGERDCSAQRRNQKVIEETPAPNLSDKVRDSLKEVACRLARAVSYRSAGTVEFIFDAKSNEFYFLEVNTRLQVEHGVTEEVYGVDIVSWMVQLARGELGDIADIEQTLRPCGYAVQARVYAEDPSKNFQPSAGLLSHVSFPSSLAANLNLIDNQSDHLNPRLRIDHWIESGIDVSPLFDPMLAKVIVKAETREQALCSLKESLSKTEIYGIETNLDYLKELLTFEPISSGHYFTSTLAEYQPTKHALEILSPGTLTTVQDYPGRTGYWDIGVPPSGPFDSLSFRLGNKLLGNPESAAGLEMTLTGSKIRFCSATRFVLAGAEMHASIDGGDISYWKVVEVEAGQELTLGSLINGGARAYLLVDGGIQCPDYLGAKSTFTLGQFGGHSGRALRTGDVLHIGEISSQAPKPLTGEVLAPALRPKIEACWELHVITGPQGAPDFFREEYIQTFFDHEWEVHFNSSRTGVRLIGPQPEWARTDGGEAGMHPSNIHDNAYAIGTIDFTGDMPVILGPDGPSLGGFVCPATVITADLWKVGQLCAGDKVRFVPVTHESALQELNYLEQEILNPNSVSLADVDRWPPGKDLTTSISVSTNTKPVIEEFQVGTTQARIRLSGDSWLLLEFGEMVLDIELRFLAHRLMLALQALQLNGLKELTPGIRSLQIHFDPRMIPVGELLLKLKTLAAEIASQEDRPVASRIIHLPLSWDDEQCRIAVEKYNQVVRKDAPWYPSNIEFIRRINGLVSSEEVKKIVFDTNYLVMGLGDVYLGAPVAIPLDPRHRLVTTKYNPARTWTAENSVGIGGSYMCIYGMEGPGGYQFVGRTLQMWNRYRKTQEFGKPWLLRFFDQIRFYEVTQDELIEIRKEFPLGNYPLRIEETEFSLSEYKSFLSENDAEIQQFKSMRENAFEEELKSWKQTGQFHFQEEVPEQQSMADSAPEGSIAVDSPVAGTVWQSEVSEGDTVEAGSALVTLESMKMEIEVNSPFAGRVIKVLHKEGGSVQAGFPLVFIEEIE